MMNFSNKLKLEDEDIEAVRWNLSQLELEFDAKFLAT